MKQNRFEKRETNAVKFDSCLYMHILFAYESNYSIRDFVNQPTLLTLSAKSRVVFRHGIYSKIAVKYRDRTTFPFSVAYLINDAFSSVVSLYLPR